MNDQSHQEEDVPHNGSTIPAGTGPTDRPGLSSHDRAPRNAQTFEPAEDVRAQDLHAEKDREVAVRPDPNPTTGDTADDDTSIWVGMGPLSEDVTGLILRTRSGGCIRLLNPDADLAGRKVRIS